MQASTTDVRDYARQLSERRRLQDEKRKEDRFLHRSLRQSEKLRALAHAKKVARDLKEIEKVRSSQSIYSAEGTALFHPTGLILKNFRSPVHG